MRSTKHYLIAKGWLNATILPLNSEHHRFMHENFFVKEYILGLVTELRTDPLAPFDNEETVYYPIGNNLFRPPRSAVWPGTLLNGTRSFPLWLWPFEPSRNPSLGGWGPNLWMATLIQGRPLDWGRANNARKEIPRQVDLVTWHPKGVKA